MTDEIYCFKAAFLATIVMHKKKASQVLKLVNSKDKDEALETEKIAKKIKDEIKEVPGVKEEYPVLDEETLQNTIIPILISILVSISPKFQPNPMAAALISIVVSMTISKVSMLQVSLTLFVREKKIIHCLQELGVISSYDEVRRFKISAAHHANKDRYIIDSEKGLFQGVSDNFDVNISTSNCLKKTHPLATVLLQCGNLTHVADSRSPIPRLKKTTCLLLSYMNRKCGFLRPKRSQRCHQRFLKRESYH